MRHFGNESFGHFFDQIPNRNGGTLQLKPTPETTMVSPKIEDFHINLTLKKVTDKTPKWVTTGRTWDSWMLLSL